VQARNDGEMTHVKKHENIYYSQRHLLHMPNLEYCLDLCESRLFSAAAPQ